MADKHVHSEDPRKPKIVAALKAISGGNKVTLVRETGPNTFKGKCLKSVPGSKGKLWDHLGHFTVTLEEEGKE